MSELVKRYLRLTVIIVIIMIFVNLIFCNFFCKSFEANNPYDNSMFLNGITIEKDTCLINEYSKKYIESHSIWAMILNNEGKIVYEFKLPPELNRNYTFGDIADYSDWYMNDYPVTMLDAPNGVVILGQKKNAIWKKRISVHAKNFIIIIPEIILLNICISILVALVLAKSFMKDLQYVINGIFDLADDKQIFLKETGYLKEIFKAINLVSDKITQQQKIIKKNSETMKNWLVGVTHDVRTPLSIIVGNTEELLNNEQDFKKRECLDKIQNQSFRIKNLLNDVNLINCLENDLIEIKKISVDVCKIMRECIADVVNIYDNDKYDFQFENVAVGHKLIVLADEHLLKRAFNNVLVNSISHNEKGCSIFVSAYIQENDVIILFEDNGIGVNDLKADELNNMTSQNEVKEHGWGILILKQVVEAHNGDTKILHSTQGMKVQITLPLKMLG